MNGFLCSVRFGSLADSLVQFSPTAASGCEADVQTAFKSGKWPAADGLKRTPKKRRGSIITIDSLAIPPFPDCSSRQGFLLGIDRQICDRLSLGTGYNLTDFADDLTCLDYDRQVWFLNVVGQH